MNFKVASAVIFAVCSICFLPCGAEAEKAAHKLSSAQLLTLVRESKSVKSKSELNLLGSGPNVTVLTTPYKGASKRDLQIEAVFVARALIEGAPGQVENVKVIFAEPSTGDSGEEGLVTNVDREMIAAYSRGQVSADKLLAAVRLIPVQPESAPNVVPGPQQERRLLIWQRIDKLSQQGTGTQPFKVLFNNIEEVVKSGELSGLSAKLEDLELKLSEQEEQVALARKSAQGKGIISPSRMSAGSRETAKSGLAKLPPYSGTKIPKSPNARLGSENPATFPNSSDNGANFGLKRLYAKRLILVKTLQRNNDQNLSRVQELLSGAEENFKLGKESGAFKKLAEIKSIVDRKDNTGAFGRPFSLRGSNFERFRKERFNSI